MLRVRSYYICVDATQVEATSLLTPGIYGYQKFADVRILRTSEISGHQRKIWVSGKIWVSENIWGVRNTDASEDAH